MALFAYTQQNTIYNTHSNKRKRNGNRNTCSISIIPHSNVLTWYMKPSHLPSHSEMIPMQKEENMPPIEKMATERDQREVSVDSGMGFE